MVDPAAAKCLTAAAPISGRYPLVELGTGALFAIMAARFGLSGTPAYLYLAAISVALALIDLDVKRLPNVIVMPRTWSPVCFLLLPAVLMPNWPDYLNAWLGAAALRVLPPAAFIYPAGMGFGDVKLAGVLGLYLGWLGGGR